ALADAITDLAHDPERRRILREGGFATAASFGEGDFDRAVEALVVDAATPVVPLDDQSTGRR
ncbi:MAG: hypothetical protein OSA99_18205, partial [Acidimicrobiales bacterium]|nr:hypothetical protein [Acidimicrobiales bacterium]